MRNLKNIGHTAVRFENAKQSPCTATAWDTSSDSLICAFGPTAENAAIELRRYPRDSLPSAQGEIIAAWDAPCPNPSIVSDRILSLHYFGDSATICLVLAGGDIVNVREEPLPGEDNVEIVGTVDAGIAAAAWSPDEELLSIVTAADTLLFMTRQFDSTVKVDLSPDDIDSSRHVSVGWGKAETQFKGKRAKALRDPTVPEHVDEGLLDETDDGTFFVTWRGDGAYLAVSAIVASKRRMIRVYSRAGILDSVSEPVDYLQGPIAWRPAGNVIAAIQNLPGQRRVVFFERNGLRHGEFDLRHHSTAYGSVTALNWNIDSTVLSVTYHDHVQLWTMGNYHYYLKQTLDHRAIGSGKSHIAWHPERPLRIVVTRPDYLHAFEYALNVCRGPTRQPDDTGLVAVIDGSTVKLTPLRIANIPPPMALHEVDVGEQIADVAISGDGHSVAILTALQIRTYRLDLDTLPVPAPVLASVCIPEIGSDRAHYIRQLALNRANTPHVLLTQLASGGCVIGYPGSLQSNPNLSRGAICILTSRPSDRVFALSSTGSIDMLDDRNPREAYRDADIWDQLRLPGGLVQVECFEFEDQWMLFGLTSGGSLYANDRMLLRQCTSFAVTDSYLVFTTSQHLLKFVHLTALEKLEIPSDTPETDERCRSIERGARIVTVIPSAYAVVLQMPRGNLETVYPRALVLASIRRDITSRNYKKAFVTCRSQRVDMNILHDHDPASFMKSVKEFVNQIRRPDYIDLFLASLRDEDVSQTLYQNTLPKTGTNSEMNGTHSVETPELDNSRPGSKVNRICDAFLEVLSSDSRKNLKNIITAHVCKSPPDLRAGLSVVVRLREQSPELAERAAEHICFLVDVNQLYNEALGLYDIELALLTAQQSQKDPREYLPYLQKLQESSNLRMKFCIDSDLGRFDKALKHLHDLGEFEELKDYMRKHELYNQAIELYKYRSEQFGEIMHIFADFLSSRNRFKEAGVAYESLSDYSSASEAYKQAGMWREALSSATLAPMQPSQIDALAHDMCAACEVAKDFQAAALIRRDYLGDDEGAVRSLCKGNHISEAIRLVGLQRHPSWLESIIEPALGEGMANMTEMLGECREQLRAQVPRLAELRAKKTIDPLAFFGGEANLGEGADIPDNISLAPTDASTAGTFMTRYTNRSNGTLNTTATRKTSKNRRREERKRAKGKKGTVYEEEYLVNSIARLIERVNSVGDEVQRLVEGLMKRRMREQALALERVMVEVVNGCHDCIPAVFLVEPKIRSEAQHDTGAGNGPGERPLGADGVLWDSLESMGKSVEPPSVRPFIGLVSLS